MDLPWNGLHSSAPALGTFSTDPDAERADRVKSSGRRKFTQPALFPLSRPGCTLYSTSGPHSVVHDDAQGVQRSQADAHQHQPTAVESVFAHLAQAASRCQRAPGNVRQARGARTSRSNPLALSRARALHVRPARHTSSEPRLNSVRQIPRTRSRCEQYYLLAVGDDSTHRRAIASLASTSMIPQLEAHDRAGCACPCMPRAVMRIAASYAHRPVLRAHVCSRTAIFLPRPTRVTCPASINVVSRGHILRDVQLTLVPRLPRDAPRLRPHLSSPPRRRRPVLAISWV